MSMELKDFLEKSKSLSDLSRYIFGKENYTNREKCKKILEENGINWETWLAEKKVKPKRYCLYCGKEITDGGLEKKFCNHSCSASYNNSKRTIIVKTKISDTLLNYFSLLVNNMNGSIFIILMLVIFIILGFFIPSYSGLAVLSIPIMAPLADTVGLPRDVIVSAYQFGQGLISFITPTGLILATLAMVDVTYNKWLKFIMPLMIIVAVFAAALLLVQVHF